MPISRAKSCDRCRAAKTRCSLATPCSRCAKRNLECHYSPRNRPSLPQRQRRDFRPILPVTADLVISGKDIDDGDPHKSCTPSTTRASDNIPPAAVATVTRNSFSSPDTTSEDRVLTEIVKLAGTGAKRSELSVYHSGTPPVFDMSGTSNLPHAATLGSGSLGASDDGSMYPYYVDPLSTYNLLSLPFSLVDIGLGSVSSSVPASIDFSSPELLSEAALPVEVLQKPHLSTRERSFHQGSLTGKMLLSQLMDYTRRFAEGKTLPPFIHPSCFLSRDEECPHDTPHSCLPKPLAICRSLTQMFYSRTPGSNDFIWDQIYTHLHQMHAEFQSYDKESLLHVSQAAIIYGLLRSQCAESANSEDSEWLVSIVETFARRLYSMSSLDIDVYYVQSSRSSWVFAESMRRTGCLLYLIDLLLHNNVRSPSKGECPEFINLPLPCTRDLWQPISDKDWKKRYNEDIGSKSTKQRRGLTMGNLFSLRRSLSRGDDLDKSGKEDLAKELSEWVEKVDDLSMLLWLALTLEGEGQAQMIQGTLSMA
ncbi:hypothetical protein V8C35DRAFT_298345 [Trichoderma chlorosporum]